MRKQAFIRRIIDNMDTLRLHGASPARRFAQQLPNNTYFMAYRFYQVRQSAFREDFGKKAPGSLKAYIRLWQTRYPVD